MPMDDPMGLKKAKAVETKKAMYRSVKSNGRTIGKANTMSGGKGKAQTGKFFKKKRGGY